MTQLNKDIFENRKIAGKELAKALHSLKKRNPIIFALPRGGVPIAQEVAEYLEAPLDVLPVKKVTPLGAREYAIGAVSIDDTLVLNNRNIQILNISQADVDNEVALKSQRVHDMAQKFRSSANLPDLSGKTVILVDDGIATGETTKAAIAAVKKQKDVGQVIVAAPVASKQAVDEFSEAGIRVMALSTPSNMAAISMFYKNFDQVSDQEVISILEERKANA